jgi:iron complex transport system substrate-binding protein
MARRASLRSAESNCYFVRRNSIGVIAMVLNRKRLCRITEILASAVLCAGLACGCNSASRPAAIRRNAAGVSVQPLDAAKGLSASIRYAKAFSLEQCDGYRKLHVLSPWRDSKTVFTYVLVPRGRSVPQAEPGSMVVQTPVQRIVISSSTHVAYLAMLGLEDKIAGIVGCKRIITPQVAARIRSGRIVDVGDGSDMYDNFNMERLVDLQPDLIMVYGTGYSEFDRQDKLLEAGFRVALNAEHMETTPLGRTEWLKFIAAFFDKDAEADRLFADIAGRYQNLAAMTRTIRNRPTIFCGSNFRGIWHVPGGRSYTAAFIHDAGARYLWDDDKSAGDMPVNAEAVLSRAGVADFWLNPGMCRSMEELSGEDERFALFQAFRAGRVFNNNARMDPGGGNDFWETGVANPDRVLADLISIFHPELLPRHQRSWYWQLPGKAGGKQ